MSTQQKPAREALLGNQRFGSFKIQPPVVAQSSSWEKQCNGGSSQSCSLTPRVCTSGTVSAVIFLLPCMSMEIISLHLCPHLTLYTHSRFLLSLFSQCCAGALCCDRSLVFTVSHFSISHTDYGITSGFYRTQHCSLVHPWKTLNLSCLGQTHQNSNSVWQVILVL